jgi:hypothetical protein
MYGKKLGGKSSASSPLSRIARHSLSTHEINDADLDGGASPERIARLFPKRSNLSLE